MNLKSRQLLVRLVIGWSCLAITMAVLTLFPAINRTVYDHILSKYRLLPARFYWLARGYTGLHPSILLVGSPGLYDDNSLKDHLTVISNFHNGLATATSWITSGSPRLPDNLKESGPLQLSPVYVVEASTERRLIPGPVPFVMRHSRSDGAVRNFYLALKGPEGKLQPCLPLVLYARFLDADCEIEVRNDTLYLGDVQLPVSEDKIGYLLPLIPYQRDALALTDFQSGLSQYGSSVLDSTIPLEMAPLKSPNHPMFRTVGEDGNPILPRCSQRLVFIGENSTSSSGQRLTPLGSYQDFQIAALALDTLIQGPWVRIISGWKAGIFYFLVSSVLAIWMMGPTSLFGRAVRLLLVGAGFYVLTLALFAAGIYLPLAWLHIYAVLLTAWGVARTWIRTIAYLRRYGGSSAARTLLRGDLYLERVEAEERGASIVFVGLPHHLRELEVNEDPKMLAHRQIFSERIAATAEKHGGIVHDFQADYLMLGFGTHLGRREPDHAYKALLACRELIALRSELSESWGVPDSEGCRVQASLNSGLVAVGWVGSREHKRASAAIGDTTNVAARLLGVARKLDLDLVVSQGSRELLGGNALFIPLESVRLKGKSEAVGIYRVEWL